MAPRTTRTLDDLRRIPFETAGLHELAADRLEPGTRLGRYLVLYRVGGGGMGTVYAAYDPDLDRKVAVKLLRRRTDPRQAAAETRREAQAMARLSHPNVVAVHDVGTFGERAFIAMEYVDGETLRDWLEAPERPWRETLSVFAQAGRGLAAAHAAGLVHLDFKPGNVMIDRHGVARVLDFGLARLSPDAEGLEGGAGDVPCIGTPAYLAPERIRGRPVDARSDQYSFCVALWEALYGEHPFAGADSEHGDRTAEIRPGAAPHVPGRVRQALRRGLSAEPEERHPTMADLLRELTRDPRQTRNRRLAAAGALLALGAVAGYHELTVERKPVCGDFRLRLAEVWDDGKKSAIRRAFLETGLPFAEEVYHDVERALDEYARDWVDMRREACEATYVFGEQSNRMLDLRMLCLDGRLEEVRALTNELTGADREVVARALAGTHRLSTLAPCADRLELTILVPPPADAESRQVIGTIRTEVEEQYARSRIGRPVDVAALERSAEKAERQGIAFWQARALTLLAREQLRALGDTSAAEQTLQRALLPAIAAGDRPVQARLYALLVMTVGYLRSRHEEARQWQRFAQAALSALGSGHEETEIEVYTNLSVFALSMGRPAEAEALARRAVEIGERIWGPEDSRLGSALNNLAHPIANDHDRIEEAIAYLERARDLAAAYGRWNPIHLAPSLNNLSYAYVVAGRYEDALAVTTRCLEIAEEFYGEHRDLTYLLINRADILIRFFDRPSEAEGFLRRALPLARAGFGESHPIMGHLFAGLGYAMLDQLRFDEARAYLEQDAAPGRRSRRRPPCTIRTLPRC